MLELERILLKSFRNAHKLSWLYRNSRCLLLHPVTDMPSPSLSGVICSDHAPILFSQVCFQSASQIESSACFLCLFLFISMMPYCGWPGWLASHVASILPHLSYAVPGKHPSSSEMMRRTWWTRPRTMDGRLTVMTLHSCHRARKMSRDGIY